MDDEDFWYWFTLSRPSNYWLGKALGGRAEKGADRAMGDILNAAPITILVVLVLIALAAVVVAMSGAVGG